MWDKDFIAALVMGMAFFSIIVIITMEHLPQGPDRRF